MLTYDDRVSINDEVTRPLGFEFKTCLKRRFAVKAHTDNSLIGCHRSDFESSTDASIGGP